MALYMLWFNGVFYLHDRLVTGMLNSILLSYAEKQVKYTEWSTCRDVVFCSSCPPRFALGAANFRHRWLLSNLHNDLGGAERGTLAVVRARVPAFG